MILFTFVLLELFTERNTIAKFNSFLLQGNFAFAQTQSQLSDNDEPIPTFPTKSRRFGFISGTPYPRNKRKLEEGCPVKGQQHNHRKPGFAPPKLAPSNLVQKLAKPH
ncbi:hypothetical protein BT96DRAFT_1010581 [Gymnopus androsaceus JB14]|uniref:Uncharacterized protein n=1 Tax=Gymnopus androsaceus JB14 TaxID=1447944 RepID=A0A6A4GAG7_9AGAR|nr:hypothetical protein BT96DRAFT_1010581 [Gymnopus androsaceus JB14]